MWAISIELTPDYLDDIDRVPAGFWMGSGSVTGRACSKDQTIHLAGDRFRTSTMTVSMKSIIRKG